MFISATSESVRWREINNTLGVSKLVSFDGKPKPLPQQFISDLMLRCDASGTLLPLKSISAGDHVEIITGPFANFFATVDTINPTQRIWVLMELMGRQIPIKVKIDQLKLAR